MKVKCFLLDEQQKRAYQSLSRSFSISVRVWACFILCSALGPRFLPLRTDGTTGWWVFCFPLEFIQGRLDVRVLVIGFQYSRRSNGVSVRGLLSRIFSVLENEKQIIQDV